MKSRLPVRHYEASAVSLPLHTVTRRLNIIVGGQILLLGIRVNQYLIKYFVNRQIFAWLDQEIGTLALLAKKNLPGMSSEK